MKAALKKELIMKVRGKKMKKLILLMVVACLVIATNVSAIPTPPGYITNGNMTWARGDAGSTWQEWDFLNNNLSAAPTAYFNPYGTPLAGISEVPVSNPQQTFAWMDTYAGRTGVWTGDAVYAEMTIPNTPSTSGSKTVWMEVGYQGVSDGDTPIIEAFGQGYVVELIHSSTVRADGDWKIMTIGWLITPNPQLEMITIGFAGTGGFIDYIKVDTQCIPVPGAIILGGIGVGFVGWFRRRRA